MADEGFRRVIKGKGLDGEDEYGFELTELDQEFLASRKQRRVLTTLAVLLVAVLVGLIVALLTLTTTPSAPANKGESETGPMDWRQSIYRTNTENLLAPTSVAVAPNGEIYVAEPQRSRVLVFDSDGAFARSVQTSKEETNTPPATDDAPDLDEEMPQNAPEGDTAEVPNHVLMERPESVFVDEQGILYVADPTRGAIFVFDKEIGRAHV